MTNISTVNVMYIDGKDITIHTPNHNVDKVLGCLYTVTFLIGLPGNTTALIWSLNSTADRSNRKYFRMLYQVVIIVDIVITSSVIPVIVSLFDNRKAHLFSVKFICAGWALLWELLPCFSVFMVAVLSVSRLYHITYPLSILRRTSVLAVISVYFSILVLNLILPLARSLSGPAYFWSDVACTVEPYTQDNTSTYQKVNAIIFTAQLSLPILPILASSLILITRFRRQILTANRLSASIANHHSATTTLILFTMVYIICNFPLFVNFIYYTLWAIDNWQRSTPFHVYYNTLFLELYSWNLTFIFFVALNSALNSLIYFYRIKRYRYFINNTLISFSCT